MSSLFCAVKMLICLAALRWRWRLITSQMECLNPLQMDFWMAALHPGQSWKTVMQIWVRKWISLTHLTNIGHLSVRTLDPLVSSIIQINQTECINVFAQRWTAHNLRGSCAGGARQPLREWSSLVESYRAWANTCGVNGARIQPIRRCWRYWKNNAHVHIKV